MHCWNENRTAAIAEKWLQPDGRILILWGGFAAGSGQAFGNSAMNGYLWDRSNMCKVRKIYLLATNGLLWTGIGTRISVKGVVNYLEAAPGKLWWMIPLSLLVFAAFFLMFTGIVRKYSERIHALPGPKEPIYKTFSLKGYLIIAFMITLGITLKYVPGIPRTFFAWFYLGLGAGLLSAGIRFLSRWWKGRGIKD